jgi:uncharacterized protein
LRRLKTGPNEDFVSELISIEMLEKTHKFPCAYTFKIIGKEEQGFIARAVAAVRDALTADLDPPYSVRATPDGCHVAVTVEPVVYSPHQVLAVYERVRSLAGLRMLF